MVRNGDNGLIRVGIIAPDTGTLVRTAAMLTDYPEFRLVLRATDLRELGPRRVPADVYLLATGAEYDRMLAPESQLWERLPPESGLVVVSEWSPVRRLQDSGGPWGWVLPAVDPETLAEVVAAVAAGIIAVDPEAMRGTQAAFPLDRIAASVTRTGRSAETRRDSAQITDREIEVLELVADGLGNVDIAKTLGISVNTVKFHLASLYSRLAVSSRAEAVATGVRLGLLPL